jgi:RNA polymerase sigma-70 factor, ECF subfamily
MPFRVVDCAGVIHGGMPDMSASMEDDARFERLYRAHASNVRAYARRRLTSDALADDVVSDVFLVVWRRLDEVPERPRAWLYGIARRALANRRRGEARVDALRERIARQQPGGGSDGETGHVLRALAQLSESDRELLMLVAWEGLEPAELAEALDARPGTIAVRLHRARRRLAVLLEAEDRTPTEAYR